MAKSPAKKSSAKRRVQAAVKPKRTTSSAAKTAVKSKAKSPGLTPYPANDAETAAVIQYSRLPSVWMLLSRAMRTILSQKWVFLGIAGVYGLLSLIIVQSLSGNLNITNLRKLLDGSPDRLANSLVTFQWLMNGSSSTQNSASRLFEIILMVIAGLATVWTLRQIMSGQVVRFRDAFYKSMAPLVPVSLVLVMVFVHLLPLLIGWTFVSLALSFNLAETYALKLLWAVPAVVLTIWSFYLLTSSVISLYIATLPDMEPMAALRSGRELVNGRRWMIMRKMLFLPIAALSGMIILLIPTLLLAPLVTPWLLFVYGVLLLPISHAYLYVLYRELLV